MTTLQDLIDLLPSGGSWNQRVVGLRQVVTELWDKIEAIPHPVPEVPTLRQAYAYEWTDDATPGPGRVSSDDPWSTGPQTLNLSSNSGDGQQFPFALLNRGQATLRFRTGSQQFTAETAGPSIDQGSFWLVPVNGLSLAGPAPDPNTLMVLVLEIALPEVGP